MKPISVETFLQSVRAREPGIRRSVDLWARITTMPVKPRAPRKPSEIAPDGRPYDESIPPFRMNKVRGNQ